MKKVLIITNQIDFLWKFELENVKLLQNMGYQIHYASNSNEAGHHYEFKQLDEMGIVYHDIGIARSPYMFEMNYKAFQQLKAIVEKEKIDMIHCHTPVGGVLGRLVGALAKRKTKVIYTVHGFHFYEGAPLVNNVVYKGVEVILALLTDVLILINREDYLNAKKFRLKKDGKIYLIPGVGLDAEKFYPANREEKKRYRRELGIEEDAFFILSVGELSKNKNHPTIIRAIAKMKEDNSVSRKLVYGICGDGYFLEDTKKMAAELGLSNSVKFFGYKSDIRNYYAAADITVFPSIREGLGMAAVESLAMGIPVIASDNRGTREYMVNGKNGFVCQPTDIDGYISGIKALMEMDEHEFAKMSGYCVESVQRFSKQYSNKIMKQIYEDISI